MNMTKGLKSSLTYFILNETRTNSSTVETLISAIEEPMAIECNQASSLLFLLLMLGTVWLGVSIFNFKKTYRRFISVPITTNSVNPFDFSRPFLSAGKQEALADYALPIAVVTMSFVGSYFFQNVKGNSI